jgi:hypothetical protein
MLKQGISELQQKAFARMGGAEVGDLRLLQHRQGLLEVLGFPGQSPAARGGFPAALGRLKQAVVKSQDLPGFPIPRGVVGVEATAPALAPSSWACTNARITYCSCLPASWPDCSVCSRALP